jgi:hypothetical protein
LEIPVHYQLRASLPPALDLPRPATIHVGKETFAAFARRTTRSPRAILTTAEGICVSVRLRQRTIGAGLALVPMSLRTLAGITTGERVQVSAVPRPYSRRHRVRAVQRVFTSSPSSRPARVLATGLGWLVMGARLLDFALELGLRAVFGSRWLSFRIIQSHPGDDDLRDTIRLHPAAFTALEVAPGGQVLVEWAGERICVRALEDHNPFGGSLSSYVKQVVGVRYDPGPPQDFPPHLIARVPAPVRRQLGIPPNTTIVVRRRIRPALVAQLNQLTVPLAGLVLAAVAFPPVRGWPLLLGIFAAAFLGLAPLRMARPPRGPWP